jgi:hypothetical protein
MYNSQPPLGKNAKKNVFNNVLWLVEFLMSEESEVTEYYNRFLDLVEPLLKSCWLDDDEGDELFSYDFHPDNRLLLFRRLLPKVPGEPPAT